MKEANDETVSPKQIMAIWAVLVALTVAGVFLSSSDFAAKAMPVLLFLAALKLCAIGHWFMELKLAHPAWRLLLAGYATVYFVGGLLI